MAKKPTKNESPEVVIDNTEAVAEPMEAAEPVAEAQPEPDERPRYRSPREDHIKALAERRRREMGLDEEAAPVEAEAEADDDDEALEAEAEDETPVVAAEAEAEPEAEPADPMAEELRARLEAIEQWKQQQADVSARVEARAEPEPETEEPPAPDLYADLFDAYEEGDTERFRQVMSKHDQALAQQVSQTVMDQMMRQKASEDFFTEFKDIAEDEQLFGMANQRIIALEQQGVPVHKAARQAGEEVRQWMDKVVQSRMPKPEPEAPTTKTEAKNVDETKQQRVERKRRTVVNLPTASSRHTAPPPAQQPSKADVIQQMRRARGLPVM